MAVSTEKLLKIKLDLINVFEDLMKSFEVTSDGICITNIEDALMRVNGKLFDLHVFLNS